MSTPADTQDQNGLPRPAPDQPIPLAAAVPCPDRDFKMRKVVACQSCEHFHGVVRLAEDDAGLAWDKTFCIQCARPITRRCTVIEVLD